MPLSGKRVKLGSPAVGQAKPARKPSGHDFAGEERLLRERSQGKSYAFYPNTLKWDKAVFDWEKKKVALSVSGEEFSFIFDPEKWIQQPFLNTGFSCECRGVWKIWERDFKSR